MTAHGNKRWYVVHAYSGFEKSVQRALEDRINRAGMKDKFGKILVPVEEVVEMKGGQKHMSERKFFPGYVLVEMEMNDDTWHLVKNTNKVTGFVGGTATKPAPTVLPPSRMAKRRPCSIAIGVISVTTIFTLSPGITISVPLGNSTDPVTSVVRK